MNIRKIANFSITALCLSAAINSACHAKSKNNQLPNIVVILADDLGLGDISSYHQDYTGKAALAETPTLDMLADQGMSFTDAHSPTALCAPSRYSVMSGNYTYRSYMPWGVWSSFAKNGVTQEDTTIGRLAKKAGYNTAFVGKWHLGGDFYVKGTKNVYRGPKTGPQTKTVDMTKWIAGNPKELGFDYDFTIPTGVQGPLYLAYENSVWHPLNDSSKIKFIDENNAIDPKFVSDKGPGMGDTAWNARELNMLLATKASDFIKRSAGDKPFLLNYWSPAVHIPHTPPREINGKKIAGTTPSNHLDMNRVLDLEVGKIIQALKDTDEYENTLIIFTSDNGGLLDGKAKKAGHSSSAQYRGSKNLAFEGGHRVPFIAVWENKIKAGSINHTLVNGTDIVATVAAVTGVLTNKQQAKDSWNLLPTLLGKAYKPREELMAQAGSKTELILRQGPWKLIIDTNNKLTKHKVTALFNLSSNPTEDSQYNFVDHPEYQDRIKTMEKHYWQVRNSKQRTVTIN